MKRTRTESPRGWGNSPGLPAAIQGMVDAQQRVFYLMDQLSKAMKEGRPMVINSPHGSGKVVCRKALAEWVNTCRPESPR